MDVLAGVAEGYAKGGYFVVVDGNRPLVSATVQDSRRATPLRCTGRR
ncbi:chloramphenicol phosphotransferase family domain protein [Ochrobactrum quorumnocens]|uniref:Chloramphenicol phosphotransferase family domain protein n=1 Tax=Ochrobactrum quorumnocens TaxID=271865 RepID=A0A248UE74_9HYPH|nr:chloramphenicol phosphotransferase family domain protein [[Ochrobactrum] quorumnocens]